MNTLPDAHCRMSWLGVCRCLALLSILLAIPQVAAAQESVDDIFGGIGFAEAVDAEDGGDEAAAGTGTITGRVVDANTGGGVPRATVILEWPRPADGSRAGQEVTTTDSDGAYSFVGIPPGRYSITFVKSGFGTATVTNFEVVADQESQANYPMQPVQVSETGEVMDLAPVVAEASSVEDMLSGLDLRLDSDQLLDVMSAEDLSRYAASDVADALKRVAGVNVVEGQFAIIRGLEDRYSSTTFNGAPIPSPDPDSQSVQLDLFPSDVVSNLAIAKSFAAESPSNSAGGSIDILTHDYPDEWEAKISIGAGWEEGARKRFLEFEHGSTAGKPSDDRDIVETDFSGSVAGRFTFLDREFRVKGLVAHEIDYRTRYGYQEGREPRLRREKPGRRGQPPTVTQSGGLALGELLASDGRFEFTQSTRAEQLMGYAGFGFDLDEDGDHNVDATFFYTKMEEEIVELRENGYFKNFDYSELIELQQDGEIGQLQLDNLANFKTQRDNYSVASIGSKLASLGPLREEVSDTPDRGAPWFASFGRTNSFERERELEVYQLNGSHSFDLFEGLEVDWVANYATTTQNDQAMGMRFHYEPCGLTGVSYLQCPAGTTPASLPTRFPVTTNDLGPGYYFATGQAQGGIFFSGNDIEEEQWFTRVDAEQAIAPFDFLALEVTAGAWWENSERDVESLFLENTTVSGTGQWFLEGDTLPQLGSSLFDRLDPFTPRLGTSDATREIMAGHASLKGTFFDDVDLVAGLRVEHIFIESKNNPLTGELIFGSRPGAFPPTYLFIDRLDNNSTNFNEVNRVPPAGTVFNDEVIDFRTRINAATGFVDYITEQEILNAVNGEIDELKLLPAVALAYRPIDGLTLRGSYSQTVARPSLRELGFYVSVAPGTDDRVVGNPQLELSGVESYDFRAEYVFGDMGDLFAVSAFFKTIEDPIEAIIFRNPLDFDGSNSALFQTFFNNPNEADLWGIEVEVRKSFDFIRLLGADFPGIDALDYLSVGGNYTYIDATVRRSPFEIDRAAPFFGGADGDPERFTKLQSERRLFGQPEWIANADISFDHPDWGTTVTLAFFAISDVLDAAGSASLGPDGVAHAFTLDRYVGDFHQLDFVFAQRLYFEGLKFKMSVKNLTNSTRRIVYDREQLKKTVSERSWRSGRDWAFSLSYTYRFGGE